MFNINGLSNEEVIESRKKYGNNSISGKKKNTFFKLFFEALGDPIIKILLLALAIKIIFLFKDFDYFETIGIVFAILVASIISAVSEYGSNKAFESMQEESSKIRVKVRRNRSITEILSDEIVVGDILILSSGDRVSADGIIVKGKLSIDESQFTGESREVYKEYTSDISNVNDNNKIYRGTTIYDGFAEILVTTVGMDTMYGKMALVLIDEDDDSPLKHKLTNLAKTISRIGYVMAGLIAISYLLSRIFIVGTEDITLNIFVSYLLEAMTLAVSVLVMSVPEGLPMMITLILSTNARKMIKDNVLVRKMVGIETAGSLNILYTDKTGTITKGKMEVVEVLDGDFNIYYTKDDFNNSYNNLITDSLIYNNEACYDESTHKIIGGNITDRALLYFANKKLGDNVKITDKLLFNSKNKYAVTIIEKNSKKIKLIKGAPDVILKYCNEYIDANSKKKRLDKEKLIKYIDEKTSNGLRAIALSVSDSIYPTDNIRRNVFVGVIFLKDDIRREAYEGVKLIKNAGINTVMITGDAKNTASAIAREVGIVNSEDDIIITSSELCSMDDDSVKRIIPNLRVVARAMPEDKKRLVMLSRELGLVTGMTGDGVNDSVALKKADVSFAMGSGTEVAKEASDIVILDDNILSISKAILYGRAIFKNIRKFVIFQITVNLVAVLLAFICPFIGISTPITVIQMLWINMIMDTLAGLAFSYEVPKEDYMMEKPKKRSDNIINKYMISQILMSSIYSLILCLIFLKLPVFRSMFSDNEEFMTTFFTLFIFLAVFNSFNARTVRMNIFAYLNRNKMFIFIILFIIIVQVLIVYCGTSVFNTVPIDLRYFIMVLLLSLTIIPVDLIRKKIVKYFGFLKDV